MQYFTSYTYTAVDAIVELDRSRIAGKRAEGSLIEK